MEELESETEDFLNESSLWNKQKIYRFLDMDRVMMEVYIRHMLMDLVLSLRGKFSDLKVINEEMLLTSFY